MDRTMPDLEVTFRTDIPGQHYLALREDALACLRAQKPLPGWARLTTTADALRAFMPEPGAAEFPMAVDAVVCVLELLVELHKERIGR